MNVVRLGILRRPAPRRLNRASSLLAVALAFSLTISGIAFADQLEVDGDALIGIQPTMNLGTVCVGEEVSRSAVLALKRTTNGNPNIYKNSSTASVTVGTPTSTNVTISFDGDAGITVPSDWADLTVNTMSTDTVSSGVKVMGAGPAGTKSATVEYTAIGTANNGTSVLTRAATLTMNWTVAVCDTTPPVITPTVAGTLGNNGWYTSDVNISWTIIDNESAISSSSGCGPTTINADTAGQTLTCSATSLGGSNTQSVTIKRDATAPTASASASPVPNGNGWNNTNVTVSFAGEDGTGSGIASCAPDVTLSSNGADESAGGTCTDKAGNVSATASVSGIRIDKTAPSLAPTVSPTPVLLGGSAAAWPNATDGLSGVDTASCGTPDTSSIGPKSVECTATDKAGNLATATASYNVIYNFAGFFRPIENNGVFNQVKAGSAIPVKFSLGGNQGLNIFAPGFPKSQPIACDASAPMDPVEETVNAGNSSLSYDAVADQYNYVWKSDKGWGNTCRKLTVQLIDGQAYTALFKFTK